MSSIIAACEANIVMDKRCPARSLRRTTKALHVYGTLPSSVGPPMASWQEEKRATTSSWFSHSSAGDEAAAAPEGQIGPEPGSQNSEPVSHTYQKSNVSCAPKPPCRSAAHSNSAEVGDRCLPSNRGKASIMAVAERRRRGSADKSSTDGLGCVGAALLRRRSGGGSSSALFWGSSRQHVANNASSFSLLISSLGSSPNGSKPISRKGLRQSSMLTSVSMWPKQARLYEITRSAVFQSAISPGTTRRLASLDGLIERAVATTR